MPIIDLNLSSAKANISTGDENVVVGAVRGYDGTTVEAHAYETPFEVYDALHLSLTGDSVVASDLATFLQDNPSDFDSSSLTIWGDSLTYNIPAQYLSAHFPGTTITKEGIPGQTSTEIAMRAGAIPVTLSIAGNQIVAGVNTVTSIPGKPLSSPALASTFTLQGSIDGIAGTLTRSETGGVEKYTFTPTNPYPVTTSITPNSTFTANVGTLNDGTVVIWAGSNDFSKATQVESNIAAMVASLGSNTHYVIMSTLNSDVPTQAEGTTEYSEITALNDYLATTYAGHYLDIREDLVQTGLSVAGLTGSGVDLTDIADDAIPTSLHLITKSGELLNAIDATATQFGYYTTGKTIVPGDVLTIGDEQIQAGAGSGYLYTIRDADGVLHTYSTTDTFYISTGSGNDVLEGGPGNDKLNAGAGNDALQGNGGADVLAGGAGSDHFYYETASDSTGKNFDTIVGFNAYADKFNIPVHVTKIAAPITKGDLTASDFNACLAKAANASHLPAHSAVLFTPNTGSAAYHGDTFLIVDLNGVAGYQANQDLVIRLESGVNLSHLSVTDFLL